MPYCFSIFVWKKTVSSKEKFLGLLVKVGAHLKIAPICDRWEELQQILADKKSSLSSSDTDGSSVADCVVHAHSDLYWPSMRKMPGIMSQMPPIPVFLKEDLASSVFLRSSQHLRDYYPRQLGLCSFTCNRNREKSPRSPVRKFPCSTMRLLRFKFLGVCAFSSSSLPITNNSNDESSGLSFIHSDASQPPFLSDYLTPAENDGSPSQGLSSLAGGIVALGKFDALHIGHRELAIQAAKIGVPFLLSFVGMAEILGWEARPPVVAKCDRKRVLSSWAPLCSNITPKEFHIEFSKVRYLSPRQFVEKLSDELGVGGVVAGQNYRFGYKAAGDSSDLVQLCNEYGMKASIVDSVMDKKQEYFKEIDHHHLNGTINERGQVSSTRVRLALADGDMNYVSQLLGRNHRLMMMVKNEENLLRDGKKLSASRSCLLNLPPKEGFYSNCSLVIGENESFVPCRIVIDTTTIHMELDELSSPHIIFSNRNFDLLGIEFGDSRV